ncbi:hypothetical protein CIY_27880 [Butyrivibrio fibrisolvens 16/4]|nr:hypothetical protein CIY_27880 [Butyrivibrio fibrisolvens 16/4]
MKNKNILIIMPKFYAYQSKMKEDLESRGANAKFYDEEPEKTKYLVLKILQMYFIQKRYSIVLIKTFK